MISDEKYPAKFTGRAGPNGTGEFYTGVTPGAAGEAMKTTWHDGTESWSFHLLGGAWLSVQREDIQVPEDEHQADEQADEQRVVRCHLPDRTLPGVHFHDPGRQEREDRCTCPDPSAPAPTWRYTGDHLLREQRQAGAS